MQTHPTKLTHRQSVQFPWPACLWTVSGRKSTWPWEEHENSSWVQIKPSCSEVTVLTTEPMCHLYLSYNVVKLLWLTKAFPSVTANKNIKLQWGRRKMKLGSVDRLVLYMQVEALYCMTFCVLVHECECLCVFLCACNKCMSAHVGRNIRCEQYAYICVHYWKVEHKQQWHLWLHHTPLRFTAKWKYHVAVYVS